MDLQGSKVGFISELETKGMRAGHFKGVMYVHLQNWEEEGYVSHRVRETDNAGLPHLEYIRTEGKFSPFEKYLTDLILQS